MKTYYLEILPTGARTSSSGTRVEADVISISDHHISFYKNIERTQTLVAVYPTQYTIIKEIK